MSLLTSKRLVISSMLLREPYRRFQRRLHPSYAQKLVQATQTLLPLQYKLHLISIPISLEKPHQPPMKPLEALPFSIDRTVSGNLPVYIKYNCNHKIKKTIIRRINGDVDKMIDQLRKIVSNAEVRKKVGKIEIPGVHKQSIESWLLRLGY